MILLRTGFIYTSELFCKIYCEYGFPGKCWTCFSRFGHL